jgi:hypothetical protein
MRRRGVIDVRLRRFVWQSPPSPGAATGCRCRLAALAVLGAADMISVYIRSLADPAA